MAFMRDKRAHKPGAFTIPQQWNPKRILAAIYAAWIPEAEECGRKISGIYTEFERKLLDAPGLSGFYMEEGEFLEIHNLRGYSTEFTQVLHISLVLPRVSVFTPLNLHRIYIGVKTFTLGNPNDACRPSNPEIAAAKSSQGNITLNRYWCPCKSVRL
ncbi:hypothetical protein Y032_0057g2821 [Ancylostoma ceylanicum]|uniref:Uncharacterized protein n=1 Tax=Ancylostoma ceylanicum TaxID=53326 RepID=A0A016U5I0_9BILA|nr:hypothetical protein Y032_0057g2821 [Ancylostoma ceylanicum]